MNKFRYWLAEKLLRLSWLVSPNRSAQQKMIDYSMIYGIGVSVINPRDIFIDPTPQESNP